MRGQTLAGHRIELELGRGGQAIVYRAMQSSLGRMVALKVLTPGAEGDPASRARFEREAASVAALEHPHILPVYDAGEEDGRCYIAMKYVAGGGLAERLRREGALDVPAALRLLAQVASALDYAHAQGLVHRDVKPANVLLGGNQHAYLADFGLSRTPDAPALTPVGAWIGTPEYVAPEVLRGEAPSAASDRYAFALLAYETLTGRVAFPRATAAAVIYSHLNDRPPRVIDVRPGLGKRASTALAAGMDKRPDRRPSSTSELVGRFAEAIESTPGALDAPAPAQDAVASERFLSTRLASTLGPPVADSRRRRRSRVQPRRIAVAALAIAAIAGLAVGVRGIGGEAPPGEAPIAAAGLAAGPTDAVAVDPDPPAPVVAADPPPPRPAPASQAGRPPRAQPAQPGDGPPPGRPPPPRRA